MRYMLKFVALVLFVTAVPAVQAGESTHTPDARMLRFPDVSADQVVFVYAGDLWIVPKTGGVARRLSSPKGQELLPKFSPDGSTIAFSGNYDGNTDIYTIPAHGGTPTRLTHHPDSDHVVEWYPDGKHILYRSMMNSPSRRFNQFFKQPVAGGMPEPLPLMYAELASFSPDGTRMAFQYISTEFRTWKRYQGGMASDLWLYDFVNNTSEKLTDFPGTDAVPMWHQDTIYFLSDRDARKKLNLWAYELRTQRTRQVTHFTEYDVKWPSIGPDAIVFENGGLLHLLDLDTETSKPLSIQVPTDLPQIRAELKNVSNRIENWSLSPTGKRALFEARGELFTVPEKHGSVRNLTNTSGVAERDPAWSPDGKYIAYFSDRTGEYELYLRPGDGTGQERQITRGGLAFRYRPVWSPDSKKIAFSDKTGSLYVVDVNDGKPSFVDKDEWYNMASYSWSPDSRWLTYAKRGANRNGNVMIYDSTDGMTRQVTSDYYNESSPVFDVEGKYLFFASNREFNPVYGDMDSTWIYPNSTRLFVATLRKDVESLLAPRSDEEEVKKEKQDEKKKEEPQKKDQTQDEEEEEAKDPNAPSHEQSPDDAKAEEDKAADNKKEEKGKKDDKGPKPVEIDFDGFESRVVQLPIQAGNLGGLNCVEGKLLFVRRLPTGARRPGESPGRLLYFDLKEREEKTILDGIDGYDISANRKKIIYRVGGSYGIVDIGENKKTTDGRIAAGNLKAWIHPQEEWRQIFMDAWRIQRDYFYDPAMHGVNWEAMKLRYSALLPYIVDREDLNYVIGEMIAELNCSHTYVSGGDIERPESLSVGLLGCDFELDAANNAYRIRKIYEGAKWDAEVRSPLRAPGLKVNEGDYLLAVNGRPMDTSRDPWAAFQGLAGEVVRLTLSRTPDVNDATEVLVQPMSSEFRLRNLAWIESNRRKVEEATQGRVGYIYVPDTGQNGQNELVRQFGPQFDKEALIIDERFNSGGQIPDRFIELLHRPTYNYWARRDHRDWQTPTLSHTGPKVMIMNGWSGSGGDAFPYYFREARLGPLVGMRTWGGLVGISGNPTLVDGGSVTAPTFGMYEDGAWAVEGYGVDPDYEVENAPHELAAGRDPQLETAVGVILNLLEKNPPKRPKKPVYPNRTADAN
ncbi:MAG TPA: PDZ domain-containing protein [Sedimentisphaerales bacterium]|nr:PDZ domain-containing protein [Sedimentisphaerales bacterium]